VNEKSQLRQQHEQQTEQPESLLGVAYSSAPSVAHVKVSGNGYKFDFWARHFIAPTLYIILIIRKPDKFLLNDFFEESIKYI